MSDQSKIQAMERAGSISKLICKMVQNTLKPGMTTKAINDQIERMMRNTCKPTFLNYGQDNNLFPAVSCISINEEICHGLPSDDRVIAEGDLVSIDLGVGIDDYTVDVCQTFEIGEVSKEADHLNYWTKTILQRAIRRIQDGICWQNIARVIENAAKSQNLRVIKTMTGHGVGKSLHETPALRNFVCADNEKIILKAGQTIAVEPMLTTGCGNCELAEDNWTMITADQELSSHWEHTILVTKTGCRVLT